MSLYRKRPRKNWSLFFLLWNGAGCCLTPVLLTYSLWRKKKGKEVRGRLKERFGLISSHQRNFIAMASARRLWIHAASVGETLSTFSLIDALLELDDSLVIILTTMTVTGARIANKHPAYHKRLIHAFVPYDTPVSRFLFLKNYKPLGSVFIESDIWPGFVKKCAHLNIPFMLVNARLSDQSFRSWSHFKSLFQAILSYACWIIPRDSHDLAQFQKLGVHTLPPIGDLKEDAPPPYADPIELENLRQHIGKRPVFIAVSTHVGEEEIIISALKQAREKWPTLLGIIVPRHPERGAILADRYKAPRRSLAEIPKLTDPLWIIDTLGEMGLFLNLSQSAFIGKSLSHPGGGHNPYEPLKAGCRTACGPHMNNWTEACRKLHEHLAILKNETEIAHWITGSRDRTLNDPFEKKHVSFSLGRQILNTIFK